jgi:predicted deacylase
VAPGERSIIDLPVANLYTHTPLTMPVHVVNGRRAGPTICVTSAIHGDELNGVEIVKRLLKMAALKRLRGCLLAVPIVNVFGFINRSRYLPDRRDLNRTFPGRDEGSVAARLAHLVLHEIVFRSDYGIDLHTGAVDRTNLPQIRADLKDPKVRQMAEAFGSPIVIDAALREGSLRQCAGENGVPMVLYEAGEALRFDELSIRVGMRGITRVLRALDMLPKRKTPRTRIEPVIARSATWVRAPSSGIVRATCRLGDRVRPGQSLASVTDPFGEVEIDVQATANGIIIGRSMSPLAHEGDALFHIARFEDAKEAQATIDGFTEELAIDESWG